jgi:hypothetical protein
VTFPSDPSPSKGLLALIDLIDFWKPRNVDIIGDMLAQRNRMSVVESVLDD